MALPAALDFEGATLDVVDRDSLPWLRLLQIGGALGYASPEKAMSKLYNEHADEFTDAMTAVVKLDTAGGKQDVRIFSARGCWLLGMFARTERAKAFRAWVLDVLEGLASPPGAVEAPAAFPRRGEADAVVDANRMFQAYLRTASGLKLPLHRIAAVANDRVRLRSGVDILADLGVLPAELAPGLGTVPKAITVAASADPWFEVVQQWCADQPETNAVLVLTGTGLAEPTDKAALLRIGKIMSALGYNSARHTRQTADGRIWLRGRSASAGAAACGTSSSSYRGDES